MRAQARRIAHEEEEESAFVSMTDMTVGFLFIMMILLAFFASMALDQDSVSRQVYESVVAERENLKEENAILLATIKKLNLDLAARDDQITALELQIAEFEAEIRRKDEEIADLRARIKELEIQDPLEAYLARVAHTRHQVLTRLRDAIRQDFPDLQVELSEESDALRFQGEGLFGSGSSKLTRSKRDIVARLAQRMDEVLPCYTAGDNSKFSLSCNPGYVMIEAVQIEGHTDSKGKDRINRNLSAARANSTFFAMTDAAPRVMTHLNLKGQPVLSVAAYGPDRPVASNDTSEGRATNRRIDLRFIMVTPQDTDGIATIREALEYLSDVVE